MVVFDSQLAWVARLLRQDAVPYWLDSGTLLGLVREGRLLCHDGDIDVGVWLSDEEALRQALRGVDREAYATYRSSYRGVSFKYKLIPREGPGRVVDVNLFSVHGAYAFCPHVQRLPCRTDGGRSVPHLLSLWRRGAWRLLTRRGRKLCLRGGPSLLRTVSEVYTWCIPAVFFQKTGELDNTGLRVPQDCEGYLQFRYGDWRTPNPDWVFWRDDPALVHRPPERVISSVSLAKAGDIGGLSGTSGQG